MVLSLDALTSNCASRSFCHYLFVEDLKSLVYIEMFLVIAIILFSLYSYYRSFFKGYDIKILLTNNYVKKLYRVAQYVLLQRKILREKYPGLMHAMIFYGFTILLIATIIRAIDYYVYTYTGRALLIDLSYMVYKLVADLGGLVALAGLIMAVIRRLFKLTRDLPNYKEDIVILVLLIVIVLTGFLLDAIDYLIYRAPWIGPYNIGGLIFSYLIPDLGYDSLVLLYRSLWVFHLSIVMISLAVIMYSKLSHIVISSLNVIFSEDKLSVEKSFSPIRDIDKIIESGKRIGVIELRDTGWIQRLNYLACIRCARCHNQCPANLSGKLLSPMNLMIKMRNAMEMNQWNREIIPVIIEPEVVWSCVTCGACVNTCPVLIDHVNTIADLRRGLFFVGKEIPDEVLSISYNTLRVGNPYAYNPIEREEWIKTLVNRGLVEIASEDKEYDILYWIGCNTSYDPNLRDIAESILEILKQVGLSVAILLEETCCGEPVRRIGDEVSFYEIAKGNHEKLSKYKFKRLLVSCPHGYTIFKRDYPSIGFSINKDIIHHSQLLKELLNKKIIIPGEIPERKVTYHDPCYLGRWNGVYDEPREVIKSIKGIRLVEMPRSREKSFCCGGGGGHVLFEIKRGVRISKLRIEEAKESGAEAIVTACPICNIMLRAEAPNYNIEVIDLAVLLRKSLKSGQE